MCKGQGECSRYPIMPSISVKGLYCFGIAAYVGVNTLRKALQFVLNRVTPDFPQVGIICKLSYLLGIL